MGLSQRAVARRYRVSLRTVQRWVQRAGEQPLDRVEWEAQSRRPHHQPRLTQAEVQERILSLRVWLKKESPAGDYGAPAIRRSLLEEGVSYPPTARTIYRILKRHGCLDANRRVRRPAPLPGWYLPSVASAQAELDQFDAVVGLVIEGGQEVEVLTGVSLHGGLIACWPSASVTTERVREALVEHWRVWGLPAFAQFDNDTRFQGPHQHRDVIGTVARLCLSLGVTPVYAPPRETGFQAAIESLNNQWQQKVWDRFHHQDLAALIHRSDQYVAAVRRRRASRLEGAPVRYSFPPDWDLQMNACPNGRIIYLRRTDDVGQVNLLGHGFLVDRHWCHRLVRAELHLDHNRIQFHGLRRAEPNQQQLLNEVPYDGFRRHFRE